MSYYYSNNQNQNNNNNGNGSVFGTIGTIVGFIILSSFFGNSGSAVSTAASLRAVSDKATVQDRETERTARIIKQWEEQQRARLDRGYKATPTEPLIRSYPPIIEWKKLDFTRLERRPDFTRFEIKQAEPILLPEMFAEKAVLDIPRLEEPRIIFDDDFLFMPTDGNIESDLSSYRWIKKEFTKKIPTKYKTFGDMGLDKYWDTYSASKDVLWYLNPEYRNITRLINRKRHNNGDNHDIIATAQDISDSMQVTETDFFSVNIVEENINNEFHDIGNGHGIVSAELDKYDVPPQFQIPDIPKNVKTAIPDKIMAW